MLTNKVVISIRSVPDLKPSISIAFSYSTTQRHDLHLTQHFINPLDSSCFLVISTLRASLYLYDPIDSLSISFKMQYKFLENIYCLSVSQGVFTMDLAKTWALSPKTWLGGIPHPTNPQHKHHDSPSSHSVSEEIFSQRPYNSARTTARSVAHTMAAY